MAVEVDRSYFPFDFKYRPKSDDLRVDSLVKKNSFVDGIAFSNASGNVIKYGFGIPSIAVGIGDILSTMSKSEQAVCVQALREASLATGIVFELATTIEEQQISFVSQENIPGGYLGLANTGTGVITVGPGFVTLAVVLHEMGHLLGLAHPFDVAQGYPILPADLDNIANTLMSYTDLPYDVSVGGTSSSALYTTKTYSPFDLMAFTWIYGNDGLGGRYGIDSTYGQTLTPGQFKSGGSFSISDATLGRVFMKLQNEFSANIKDLKIVNAGNFNDTIQGLTGELVVEGRGGIDSLVLNGNRSQYQVDVEVTMSWLKYVPIPNSIFNTTEVLTRPTNHVVAQVTGQGLDARVFEVERVRFADMAIALDVTNGFAGDTIKCVSVVFGHEAPMAGVSLNGVKYSAPAVNGAVLSLLDTGMALKDVMQLALSVKLGTNFTSSQLAGLLLQNLTGASSVDAISQVVAHQQALGLTAGELAVAAASLASSTEPSFIGLVGHIDMAQWASTGLPFQ